MPNRCALMLATIALVVAPLACASSPQRLVQQESRCLVHRIVDGDTFHCLDGRTVRLIGIDSPERQQHPFGSSARHALTGMLPPGAEVRLEYDLAPRDRYGRLLAYAWTDSTLVNEAMVREGWAVLYTVAPNDKYVERFSRAQNEARADSAGLWARNGFACSPGDFRRRACLSSP